MNDSASAIENETNQRPSGSMKAKRKASLSSVLNENNSKITTDKKKRKKKHTKEDQTKKLHSNKSNTSDPSSNSQKKNKSKRSKKNPKRKKPKGKSVSFGTVQVLEFNYTLGHSVPDKGPPIGLSYEHCRSEILDVDSYEARRKGTHSSEEELFLSSKTRIRILAEYGYSEEEIQQASRESTIIRIHRRDSVKNMQWDEWAARKESFGRKVKRWTNSSYLYSRTTQLLHRPRTTIFYS